MLVTQVEDKEEEREEEDVGGGEREDKQALSESKALVDRIEGDVRREVRGKKGEASEGRGVD